MGRLTQILLSITQFGTVHSGEQMSLIYMDLDAYKLKQITQVMKR